MRQQAFDTAAKGFARSHLQQQRVDQRRIRRLRQPIADHSVSIAGAPSGLMAFSPSRKVAEPLFRLRIMGVPFVSVVTRWVHVARAIWQPTNPDGKLAIACPAPAQKITVCAMINP